LPQPAKDAARQIAFAEDKAIFEGYPAADITGLRTSASLRPSACPPTRPAIRTP
jgi:uncharacterized linocin/CFP29 family protein